MKHGRKSDARPTLVLGIMSGTSIDGVDYALCRISSDEVKLIEMWHARFPASLKKQLHDAAGNRSSSYQTAQMHHDLGRFYALHARKKAKVQLAGLHGQTIFHQPEGRHPVTFQAGEPAYLAEATGVPVVSNFRTGDLAAGGQGAPLATAFHRAVFAERGSHVCVHNLGGISNVTSLDWRGKRLRVLSFDTGPANMLIDMAVRHFTRGKQDYDKNGRWAARGKPDNALLAKLLKHPFFRKPPPKSTGREVFGEAMLGSILQANLSGENMIATLTELTAESLALNYRLHLPCPPDRVILAGGGALNAHLVNSIARALRPYAPDMELITCEALGWPVQAIEPAAFAYLAWLRWNRKPGNLPETTGASREVLLGQITEA